MNDSVHTCSLMGSTTLLVRCGRVLLERGWRIQAVFSDDPRVTEWCREFRVPVFGLRYDLDSAIGDDRNACLFSIVNNRILKPEELDLFQGGAYNYHDAPLPAYAGMYATFWALYNGETEHGITWHRMDPGIDTGTICVQQSVFIEKGETSFTLNTKCYHAAVEAFSTLVEKIAGGTLEETVQPGSERSYYSRDCRPANACLLDFNDTAETVAWQCRAFDFGEAQDNPIGHPKVFYNDRFYIVRDAEVASGLPDGPPGTKAGGGDDLSINCLDGIVRFRTVQTMEGVVLTEKEIHELVAGPSPEFNQDWESRLPDLSKRYRDTCKTERKWVNRLLETESLEFPFYWKTPVQSGADRGDRHIRAFSDSTVSVDEDPMTTVSRAILYLARLSGRDTLDVWWETHDTLHDLYAPAFPVRLELEVGKPAGEMADEIRQQLERTFRDGPYLRDIRTRYRNLQDYFPEYDFSMVVLESEKDSPEENGTNWTLAYISDSGRFRLYHPAYPSAAQVARLFLRNLSAFISEITSGPSISWTELPLVPEVDRPACLEGSRGPQILEPGNTSIHGMIEAWVDRSPDEVALIFEDKHMTYSELDRQSSSWASVLLDRGVRSGDRIGICLPRSLYSVTAIYAVLKAGGAYVYFNLAHPESRLRHMISDSGIKWVITSADIARKLDFGDAVLLELKNLPGPLDRNVPGIAVPTGTEAYVMYTSGSTGLPKGVPISHANVTGFIAGFRQLLDLKKRRVGTTASPFSFDVSVEEIFSTLCYGGTLHIISRDLLMAPKRFAAYLFDNRITVAYIIPNLLEHVAASLEPDMLDYLECLLTGIHAKKNRILKMFRDKSPGLKIINTYGPTETTYGATGYIYRGDETDSEDCPIGRPFPGYEVYIADKRHQLLPDGAVGELLIGGAGVSSGYLNRPELNASKFIQTDFSRGQTLYATGDLVYRDSSGDIHFLGRRDKQVKIRGNRIEIGEVEEALAALEEVDRCVVISRKWKHSHQQLVAYVISSIGNGLDIRSMKRRLGSSLPAYAVPSYILPVKAFPTFPNGKINYHRLEEAIPAEPATGRLLPEGPVESLLYDTWTSVFQSADFGVTDHFFRMGGDSLNAVDVIGLLEKRHGIRISISTLYRHPSIRELATAIVRSGQRGADVKHIALYREGNSELPFFFVHGQNGSVAFLHHLIDAIRFPGSLYSVQAGLDYEETDELEAVARRYVAEIEQMGVKRCTLCGFSFGGILALEMGRLLKKQGVEVCLIMLDSKPNRILHALQPLRYRLSYGWKVISWLIAGERSTGGAVDPFPSRIGKLRNRLGNTQSGPDARKDNLYLRYGRHSKELIRHYRPAPYEGNIHLVKAMLKHPQFIGADFPRNYWKPFVKGMIHVHPLDIHHYDFGDEEFAGKIAACIDAICPDKGTG